VDLCSVDFRITIEDIFDEVDVHFISIGRRRWEDLGRALQRPARGQMSLKVSEKGALSVYGLGRFPVTLYREQWEKLVGMADEIRAFIQENDGALKKKE